MTIVIGLICNNAIVLASDSQTSDVATGQFRRNVDKIHKLRFKDGKDALVAESGNPVFTANVIETLTELAANESLEHNRSLAWLAEEALARLRKRLSVQNPDPTSLKAHFDSNSAELMLADYANGRPNLFTLDFGLGVANRTTPGGQYSVIGCGAALAKFILDKFHVADMQLGEAIATAIFTVEEVKKSDLRCQGPTKAAFSVPDQSSDDPTRRTLTVLMSAEEVQKRVEEMNK